MRRNVVLISNYGNDLTHLVEEAEAKRGRSENTFDVISLRLDDVDLAIVDLGANLQSLAIIEAFSHSEPSPPVIALVDKGDRKAVSDSYLHGAAACLTKPFCADELARLIEAVCASPSRGDPP